MTASHVVVLSTVPSSEEGARIARQVVEEGLAACVNVLGAMRSIYRWKGEVCDETETLLVAKTRAERVDELARRIVELHPYEVPEVIALPVLGGHAPYLAWIDELVGS